jgi:hypothetical protein
MNALAYKVKTKATADMSVLQIRQELRRLDDVCLQLADIMIEQGRGHEKLSETFKQDDELSRHTKSVYDRIRALQIELGFRIGP